MRLKAIAALVLVSITMSLTSCVKITYNRDLSNNTESGNVLVNSNLMSTVNSLGANYEFIPLEYKNGIVRGIISPEKIDKYYIDNSNTSYDINPIRYVEYTLETINLNANLVETGEVLDKEELSGYKISVENPLDIVINDKINKKEMKYELKDFDKYRVEKNQVQSYRSNMNGESYMVSYESIQIYDENNNPVDLSYSSGTIVGKDKRYIHFNYMFGSFNENEHKINKIIYVLYDSQSQEFYELEVNDIKDYWGQEGTFFEVSGELYYIKVTGEINKVILKEGNIELEDFYKFDLKDGERLNINYTYNNYYTNSNEVIMQIGSESSGSGISYSKDIAFNFIDKSITDYKINENKNIFINKIFGEDDLILITDYSSNTVERAWIAKLKGSNYEKIVEVDKYSNGPMPYREENIQDILYDSETKSFFIKRKVKIDKKQTYQYEVVFLN